MFEGLNPPYGAILADPPWRWESWGKYRGQRAGLAPKGSRSTDNHYETQETDEIKDLPISDLAAKNCVLFLWVTWPMLPEGLDTMASWGFSYKTCAFAWIKADVSQIDLFRDDADADMLLGYWTRANSEVCLLGTKGQPKRLDAGVRQGIIEPRRQHSRKPSCVHRRIERLVAGPYLELFARERVPGWDAWGNETTKFSKSVNM